MVLFPINILYRDGKFFHFRGVWLEVKMGRNFLSINFTCEVELMTDFPMPDMVYEHQLTG